MDARERALNEWALAKLGLAEADPVWTSVSGDASARRYFRLRTSVASSIAVDAPPSSEKNAEFLQVRRLLETAGVCVPAEFASDLEHGYLLLGDLGDQLLLPLLNPATASRHYALAFEVLTRIQSVNVRPPPLPLYDRAVLTEELERFPQWFVGGLLQQDVGAAFKQQLASLNERLICTALEQPQVLVHRDYHSRNLLPQPDGSLGVIDFQDAVIGPLCYDLVSLLRDCYIQWPPQQVRRWALDYYSQWCQQADQSAVSEDEFMRWFDFTGLQRHLKVLGNFSRLALRDGKDGYLADIPLVLSYVMEVLRDYPEFDWLAQWFSAEVLPWVKNQSWAASA